LYECQNKAVTEIAFRKLLILKDAILVVLGLQGRKKRPGKRKTGTGSRHPNVVFYRIKYTKKQGKVNCFFVLGERCDEVEQGVRTAQECSELA